MCNIFQTIKQRNRIIYEVCQYDVLKTIKGSWCWYRESRETLCNFMKFNFQQITHLSPLN